MAQTAADYDKGEVTDRERLAADRQKEIAQFNADTAKNQLAQQLANYDMSNQQARRLADVEKQQNAMKLESDRFNAYRDLQSSALGLLGTMNQALYGSSVGNLMSLLRNRNDRDNESYWSQYRVNNDQVENAYTESFNENQVAKNDAAINAEQAIRSIEGDLGANTSNINPNVWVKPGEGEGDLGGRDIYNQNRVQPNLAQLSGYVQAYNSPRSFSRRKAPNNNQMAGNYFGQLMNSFNGGR